MRQTLTRVCSCFLTDSVDTYPFDAHLLGWVDVPFCGATSLLWAVKHEDEELVESLLGAGARVNMATANVSAVCL